MEISINSTQITLKRSLLNAFILIALSSSIASAMCQEGQDQKSLREICYTDAEVVDFEGVQWKRTVEQSPKGLIVELSPEGTSKHKGAFLLEKKEIRQESNNTFSIRTLTQPTETFAFILGSAFIATAIYSWWYYNSNF